MFSIGSHKARYSFITKVVYLPPVKLGVVLLTQNKKKGCRVGIRFLCMGDKKDILALFYLGLNCRV